MKKKPQLKHLLLKMLTPRLIVLLGVSLFVLIWAVLIFTHLYSAPGVRHHPLIILTTGILLSLILALFIDMAQSLYQRTLTLEQLNQNLTAEMSERTEMGTTKAQLEAALLQGQKLQAMGTLAGGIAHDFNNILYAIIGFSQMAQEDISSANKAHHKLNKILEAAHRGQELIARILAFSRHQHHHFAVINLKTTIDTALSLFKRTVPASVMIKFDAEADGYIYGDQTQIHQILINLINNAVDATEGEGHIHIKMTLAAPSSIPPNPLQATLTPVYFQITVADNGAGMDKKVLERIFEPFFTTKEVGKGTGLGLSIVYGIVKDHQGEIQVASQLGKGTTFTLLLPAYVP